MNDAEHAQTVLAQGTTISGTITLEGPATILGTIEGSLKSSDRVEIGRSARVNAELDAATVLVDGEIEGDVTARDRLELNATARVNGDVTARTLIVSEGATFSGHCRVGAEADPQTTPTPQPQQQHTNGDARLLESKPEPQPALATADVQLAADTTTDRTIH